jgi:hypothetical protein
VRAAQVLGEALRAFELRGRRRRAEGRDPFGAERVGEAFDQRLLGPDHDQPDGGVAAEGDDRGVIGRIEADDRGDPGNPGVTRRAIELAQPRRLRELPAQRVLASATADHQDVHAL